MACATPARIKGITAVCAPTPMPDPRLVLVPDPLGLELLWPTARHLSASVSALLHSSCRAEHRSPGACTSRPTGPALLACPAPTTGPAPDAVPAPATAADHTSHSTAAHCCHRYCPHPQVCGHPHTDHRSACRLRIQPGNRKLLPSPKAHRGWTGSPLAVSLPTETKQKERKSRE